MGQSSSQAIDGTPQRGIVDPIQPRYSPTTDDVAASEQLTYEGARRPSGSYGGSRDKPSMFELLWTPLSGPKQKTRSQLADSPTFNKRTKLAVPNSTWNEDDIEQSPAPPRQESAEIQVPNSQPEIPQPIKNASMPPPMSPSIAKRSSKRQKKHKEEVTRSNVRRSSRIISRVSEAKNLLADSDGIEGEGLSTPALVPAAPAASGYVSTKPAARKIRRKQADTPIQIDGQDDMGSANGADSANDGRSSCVGSKNNPASSRTSPDGLAATPSNSSIIHSVPRIEIEEQQTTQHSSRRKSETTPILKAWKLSGSSEDLIDWVPPVRGLGDTLLETMNGFHNESNKNRNVDGVDDSNEMVDTPNTRPKPVTKSKKTIAKTTRASGDRLKAKPKKIQNPVRGTELYQETEQPPAESEKVSVKPQQRSQNVSPNTKRRLRNGTSLAPDIDTYAAAEIALYAGQYLSINPDRRSSGEFTGDEKELIRRAIRAYMECNNREVEEVVEIIHHNVDEYDEDVDKFWNELGQTNPKRQIQQIRKHTRIQYRTDSTAVWTDEQYQKNWHCPETHRDADSETGPTFSEERQDDSNNLLGVTSSAHLKDRTIMDQIWPNRKRKRSNKQQPGGDNNVDSSRKKLRQSTAPEMEVCVDIAGVEESDLLEIQAPNASPSPTQGFVPEPAVQENIQMKKGDEWTLLEVIAAVLAEHQPTSDGDIDWQPVAEKMKYWSTRTLQSVFTRLLEKADTQPTLLETVIGLFQKMADEHSDQQLMDCYDPDEEKKFGSKRKRRDG